MLAGHTDTVYRAEYSPDGSRIVTTSRDGTARLWDSEGKQLAVLVGHTAKLRRAAFSPDGSRIITASDDMTARLYRVPATTPNSSTGAAAIDGHQGTAHKGGTEGLPRVTAEWYEVVSQRPGPEVTDATMRRKIEESGQPWKVRDRATGIEMVLVMPGEFLMGSPESEPGRNPDEGPQHRARLTKAYYLGVAGVTQAQ